MPSSESRVDEACDRFEEAWRAGPRPRIEDGLAGFSVSEAPEVLRQLLRVEIELRRRAGEEPAPDEYRRRFPGHDEAVAAAFEAAPPHPGPPRGSAGSNLLLGLLALQNNFIGRDALLAAFTAWVADKSEPLGRVLLRHGALDTDTLDLLEALARKHLQLHDDDTQKSLADLSSIGPIRQDLGGFADPDLQASLSRVAVGSGSPRGHDDPEATSHLADPGRFASSPGSRFRILRPHARGGLGLVFIAQDEELHREVALKQIRPEHADDPASRTRFVREAEITGALEHPGIVPVYGLGAYGDGCPFYAMRFIRGDGPNEASLREAIQQFHRDEGPGRNPGERALALHQLLRRFLDVCNAVAYAHSRGVLHRDLKPGNILLGPYGETLVVDWGLAKVVGRPDPGGPVRRRCDRRRAAKGPSRCRAVPSGRRAT